ncbi:hypothetical protein PLICRDRAFT_349231 [Plicaturopsis crispa FD-325 SS-3]|uniref:Uncharacterized protein n=1 Tax=Plicaturopsis crispa FD-325 SS-3 TaxID=944288 RepID=A0A0C9SYC4_PLICR|nr:hypothetical protein PLICRDRAFT_349231 [Plicaturopsis crispa FD-325 SS-3]
MCISRHMLSATRRTTRIRSLKLASHSTPPCSIATLMCLIFPGRVMRVFWDVCGALTRRGDTYARRVARRGHAEISAANGRVRPERARPSFLRVPSIMQLRCGRRPLSGAEARPTRTRRPAGTCAELGPARADGLPVDIRLLTRTRNIISSL